MRTVCIFAGARGKPYLYDDARLIAIELVRKDCRIIYGGSSKGVMGSICQAVKDYNGSIIGVLPEKVADLKHYDPDIQMIVASTMAGRKQAFWDKSDAYLLLPGSYGSLDELYEILTLTKLGYIEPAKPIVIYNQLGYYDPLIAMHSNMVSHGFMPEDRADLVKFVTTVQDAVKAVTE